jgi:uroporphyrinogen-III synthase
MERLGALVTEIVAYKTVRPEPQELSRVEATVGEGADAVLFFSPSAVHHLQDHLGNEKFLEFSRRAVFAAIGPVTEVALRQVQVERVLVARDTTVSAVVTALTQFFSKTGSRLTAGVKPG